MPVRRAGGMRPAIRGASKAPYRRARARLAGLKGFKTGGGARSAMTPAMARAAGRAVLNSVRSNLGMGVARGAAAVAGAASNPLVGAALNAALDYVTTGTSTDTKKGRKYGSSHLAGKLARKRVVRSATWKKNEREGVTHRSEVSGNIKDNDCIYLGYTPINPSDMSKLVLRAIVRKMLQKALKFNPPTIDTVIDYSSSGTKAEQLRFRFWREQADGTLTDIYNYQTVAGSSIASIADAMEETFLNEYAQNDAVGTGYHTERLYKITLEEWTDVAGVIAHRKLMDFNLVNAKVYLDGWATLQLQNRTVNDAGDDDKDDVNNVPIIGKRYVFNGVCPVTHVPRPDLNMINQGVITMRAGEVGGVQDNVWDEPPEKSTFVNCSKVNRVAMNPGDVKKDRIAVRVAKSIRDFMQMINERRYLNRFDSSRRYRLGECHLFALEKSLNFGLNVDVVYTIDIKMSCRVTTWDKIPVLAPVYYMTKNDV